MRLPDFPWDQLASFKEKARAHPYGLVDLSVGTPVDSTPAVIQQALAGAADASGYPQVVGTPDLREAAAGWLARRLGVLVDPGAILPVLGTKELVAQLPAQLGLEPGDRVWVPTPAYPTYEVGALLARCVPVVGPTDGVTLVWMNSPGNPTGRVMSVDEMRAVVGWARERGVIVASDECYIELGWEGRPVSVLHPDVCGGSHEGLLAVHSLSKRSNLAGYRAGFVTGDPELVAGLVGVRKHAGFMMPTPVQAAMAAAYADDLHVADQRGRYANRRAVLAAALSVAGFTIDHSEAGLYLWATRGEDAWATLDALAGVGVLVAPGTFYGEAGRQHVRVALTAPDSQVATVPERMAMIPPAVSAPGTSSSITGVLAPGPSPGYRQAQPGRYPQPAPAGGYVEQPRGYTGAVAEGGRGYADGYGGSRDSYADPREGHGSPRDGYADPRQGHADPRQGYEDLREGYADPREGYSAESPVGYPPAGAVARVPYESAADYELPLAGYGERSGPEPRPGQNDAPTGGYPVHPGGYPGRPGAYAGRPGGYQVPPAAPESGRPGRPGPYDRAPRRAGRPGGYEDDPDRYADQAGDPESHPESHPGSRPGSWNGEPDIR
ncbi:Aminotransferase [Frankia sp. AiPs1]|uniref:succinyldiaminopimelate transaminase n=1 Tax=Frankia sp. AiPa1 TaxID=573492 RepID=UPI00202B6478|nr:succinyldiaminopimelate transaminase [Frankia sp. AiPa1]MCL9758317.1 succinyldiaminopimelate transaminase [Frankia sp. AiPa1]